MLMYYLWINLLSLYGVVKTPPITTAVFGHNFHL